VIIETSGFDLNTGIELLAERCAPIQCHYIGFHASTGLDTIDWFIGDEVTAAPELENQYVENLWRLPRTWLACRKLADVPLAASTLNDQADPVLGSFNQFGKVRDETLDYWAAALRELSNSQLHLKSASSDSAKPKNRILAGLEKRGIQPGRVRFLDRTDSFLDHLRCYNGIDIALDATPWAGATTSIEALTMGVPVVGIQGSTTAGRMTCSILHGIKRDDWIAQGTSHFSSIVSKLSADVARLRREKPALQREVLNSSLYDGRDLARHLEETFHDMACLKGLHI
jgi:predicted O-linked N-acetylglucosamine transferase (SPINDLY family)